MHLLKPRLPGVLRLLQDACAAMFIGHDMICSLPQSKGKGRMAAEGRYIGQLNSSPVLIARHAYSWLLCGYKTHAPCRCAYIPESHNPHGLYTLAGSKERCLPTRQPCMQRDALSLHGRELCTLPVLHLTPYRMACTSAVKFQISIFRTFLKLRTHKAGDAAALRGLRPLSQLVRSLQLLCCIVSVLLLPCNDLDCQASRQHLHPALPLGMHKWMQGCPG